MSKKNAKINQPLYIILEKSFDSCYFRHDHCRNNSEKYKENKTYLHFQRSFSILISYFWRSQTHAPSQYFFPSFPPPPIIQRAHSNKLLFKISLFAVWLTKKNVNSVKANFFKCMCAFYWCIPGDKYCLTYRWVLSN